eukprot:756669-Hanusia_phi.AAC.2
MGVIDPTAEGMVGGKRTGERRRGCSEGSKKQRLLAHGNTEVASQGSEGPPSVSNPCCSCIKVGIVSDTHGSFDERLKDVFRGVDEIWHGGDHAGRNGSYESAGNVLKELNKIAPVTCMVRGNVDKFAGGLRGQKGFSANTPPEFARDFPLYAVRQDLPGASSALLFHICGFPEEAGKADQCVKSCTTHSFHRKRDKSIEGLEESSATDAFVAGKLQELTGDEDGARRIIKQYTPEVVVFGHSHQARISHYGGVLFINPGSAGPRRFSLPKSACVLEIYPEMFVVQLYKW